jgi:hypothetical protein
MKVTPISSVSWAPGVYACVDFIQINPLKTKLKM